METNAEDSDKYGGLVGNVEEIEDTDTCAKNSAKYQLLQSCEPTDRSHIVYLKIHV